MQVSGGRQLIQGAVDTTTVGEMIGKQWLLKNVTFDTVKLIIISQV